MYFITDFTFLKMYTTWVDCCEDIIALRFIFLSLFTITILIISLTELWEHTYTQAYTPSDTQYRIHPNITNAHLTKSQHTYRHHQLPQDQLEIWFVRIQVHHFHFPPTTIFKRLSEKHKIASVDSRKESNHAHTHTH